MVKDVELALLTVRVGSHPLDVWEKVGCKLVPFEKPYGAGILPFLGL